MAINQHKIYDYIIAGGGAAGLDLACRLLTSTEKDKRILIIDRDAKETNDRTWCFWTKKPTFYDPIRFRVWNQIRFSSESFERVYSLAPYHYQMIRGIDFYRYTRETITQHPQVEWIKSKVEKIEDGEHFALVTADGIDYAGKWVFDSLFQPQEFKPDPSRYHYVKQHFLGWEIETDHDYFEPHLPTLFDFRVPQKGVMRFCYILPFTPRKAMVEYTLFSSDLLPDQEYRDELKTYILTVLKIQKFSILAEEKSVIPMTDHPFPRKGGKHILYTGTKGGRVKPSTGYAFLRIQQDSEAIVRSLVKRGHPFDIPKSPWRFQFYDSIMLQLMFRRGSIMEHIFTILFKNNPIQRLFSFLDETSVFPEDLFVLLSLPPRPFLKAMWKIKFLRKI